MRKLSILAGLGLFISASAFSATTGVLQLQGVVASELSIVVNSDPAASSLDLSATQTDLSVGSVDESSNSSTGYQISVSSLNDGNLTRSGGSEAVAYTFKYDGAQISLGGTSSAPAVAKTVNSAGVVANNSGLSISYTGAPGSSMVAGTYQDTLTFEISAN